MLTINELQGMTTEQLREELAIAETMFNFEKRRADAAEARGASTDRKIVRNWLAHRIRVRAVLAAR